jgi:hypothetical protein
MATCEPPGGGYPRLMGRRLGQLNRAVACSLAALVLAGCMGDDADRPSAAAAQVFIRLRFTPGPISGQTCAVLLVAALGLIPRSGGGELS